MWTNIMISVVIYVIIISLLSFFFNVFTLGECITFTIIWATGTFNGWSMCVRYYFDE